MKTFFIVLVNFLFFISVFSNDLKDKNIVYYYLTENLFKNDEVVFFKNIIVNFQNENTNILFYNPYKDKGIEEYNPLNEYFLKITYANDCSVSFQEENSQILLTISLNRTKCNMFETKELVTDKLTELTNKVITSEKINIKNYKDYIIENNNIFKNTIFIYCSDKIKKFSKEYNLEKNKYRANEIKKYNSATKYLFCSDQVFNF